METKKPKQQEQNIGKKKSMKEMAVSATEASSEGKEENLPPGFRFHPTDEELITYYLVNKISDADFTGRAIADVDLNKSEPWDLPGKAKMGEKEWYFFSLRDRKYPTGVRTNRATNTGYWKTTGKDKEIFNGVSSELVGMKKTLVFYRGRAPRGEKTNWVMHEYRIHTKSSFRTTKDEWVVCRVFQKTAGVKKYPSNQSRAVNPYNLDIGAAGIIPPAMMPPESYQLAMGRNYTDLAELSRVLRVGPSSTLNLPMQNQINYPGTGAGGFTISGLNLNLGGGCAPNQPALSLMRAMQPPPPAMQPPDMAAATMSMMNTTPSYTSVAENGYGNATAEISNANGTGNRFLAMDHCMDLDTFWPAY